MSGLTCAPVEAQQHCHDVHAQCFWIHLDQECSGGSGKPRFEVYVCTTALRDYAMEAWRLLDPGAHLIPMHLRRQRICCVSSSQLKSVEAVLGLGALPKPAMPLAIILDDRTEARSCCMPLH